MGGCFGWMLWVGRVTRRVKGWRSAELYAKLVQKMTSDRDVEVAVPLKLVMACSPNLDTTKPKKYANYHPKKRWGKVCVGGGVG